MSSNIANALERASQFTPQPDSLYQEKLGGLGAVQVAAPRVSNTDILANNLQRLEAALGGYQDHADQAADSDGLEKATAMINSSNPEEMAKLDVVDMAQQRGYGDLIDNKYFLAYSEKLRGESLSTKCKQDYDRKYADAPAKSADEEVQRLNQHITDWKANNLNIHFWNKTAFDNGFNENHLVNQAYVANEHIKKEINENATILYANTQAKLAQTIDQAPELLKTNGALTDQVQKILNEPRLMGLDPTMRLQMIDNFTQEFVKSGYIDADRLEAMIKRVTVQTNMDGTNQTMFDLLDPVNLKVQANNYRMQFKLKEDDDFIKKFEKDKNLDKFHAEVDQLQYTDPLTFKRHMALVPAIESTQNAYQAEQKRAAAERNKQAQKAFNQTAGSIYIKSNMTAYYAGNTKDAYGNSTANIRIPKGDGTFRAPTPDELQAECDKQIAYITDTNNQPDMSAATRASYFMKTLNYPPFKEAKQSYMLQYGSALRDIRPETITGSDGNVYIPQNVKMLISARQADSSNFVGVFGEDIDQRVARLQRYADIKGSMEDGAMMYAQEASTPEDVRNNYQTTARMMLAGSSIEGLHQLGGGDTANLYLSTSGEATAYVEAQASAYMCAGLGSAEACKQALNDVRDGFSYYHGAMIPKGAFNGMGTNDNEGFGRQAVYSYLYDFASSAGTDSDDVTMRYDTTNQTFTFVGGGQMRSVALSDILNQGQYLAANQEHPDTPHSTADADSINNARAGGEASPYNDSSGYEYQGNYGNTNNAIPSASSVIHDIAERAKNLFN